MSKRYLSPYINFQGRAREAMEFYREVLGGELELRSLDERGLPRPAGPRDRITYARLEVDGALLIGSDGHPDYPPSLGDHIGIALGGGDEDRLAEIFTRLAEGGTVKMPLTEQPWGGRIGWLMDRFGINWMVSVEASGRGAS
ncbi:MAG TPA: VOC family protein [Candidatus Dormibacteraeota bacterium]|nr:VOC family protein [Candidatus Dormibacteraeota bacterium]